MKTQDRDNLLIRLDERTRNIWKTIEKMEIHLVTLNNSVAENTHFRKMAKPWFVAAIAGVMATILKLIGIY